MTRCTEGGRGLTGRLFASFAESLVGFGKDSTGECFSVFSTLGVFGQIGIEESHSIGV